MVEMKKIAIGMIVFLMFFNASPGLLMASGIAEDWGVAPTVGGDKYVEDANSGFYTIDTNNGDASTLFQLYTSVTGSVKGMVGLLFGGPLMLEAVGVPSFIVSFIFIPQYLMAGAVIVYTLSGRVL